MAGETDDDARTDDQVPDVAPAQPIGPPQRVDKWLWFTRIVKSRTIAAGLVTSGKVRLNKERITKASHTLRPGDVLTVLVHRKVRVLKVLAPGTRRGPAQEAQRLYEDLTPESVSRPSSQSDGPRAPLSGTREAGAGRPTKRDRRLIDRFKSGRE